MSEHAARRARRASELVFGKATTFAEHTEQSEEFWRNARDSDKLQAIVELVRDSWYLAGNDGPPARLD